MKNVLSKINFIILIAFICLYIYQQKNDANKIHGEIKVERLSIVGPDGHLYIAISNPEKQAIATRGGKPLVSGEIRDVPGIVFFNRIGDEIGGIYQDGTESESSAGIMFDQQGDDQILAITKDEWKEGDDWKRWYGLWLRERSDSITQWDMFQNFYKETEGWSKEEKDEAYKAMRKKQDEELNVFRMFLGREENEQVGLFLYDSRGKERIKLYVDESDNAILEFLDKDGNSVKVDKF